MSMPDLWSPAALVPKPRAVVRPIAIVPRERIYPRPKVATRPALSLAERREIEVKEAWREGFEVARKKFGADNPSIKSVGKLRSIIAEVAAKHALRPEEITSGRRLRNIVIARHEAMSRCFHGTVASYTEIGRAFNKDHTTIMHGVAKHAERLAKEAEGK